MELLNKIQQELVFTKNQTNAFGKYKYRSCEDILEAVKPLLGEGVLTVTDEMVQLGDRFYVKATATLMAKNQVHEVSAYARETFEKKGMDSAQITGAASSYARKYALNGLFCIDDTKDADTRDNRTKKAKPEPTDEPDFLKNDPPEPKDKPSITKKFKALPQMSGIEKAIMTNVIMKCGDLKPIDLNKRDFNKQIAIETIAKLSKYPDNDEEEQVTIELIQKMYGKVGG